MHVVSMIKYFSLVIMDVVLGVVKFVTPLSKILRTPLCGQSFPHKYS